LCHNVIHDCYQAPELWECAHSNSPLNRSFFRSINLRKFFVRAVEEAFHIVHQKALRVGAGQIQSVVIDDARLRLQPFGPARLASFGSDFLAQLSWQWRVTKRWALLPATGTFDLI
jgi:hypothetical protein